MQKTVVFQSFRTENVPVGIERCMASVRQWAESQNIAYRFFDDAFFDRVPEKVKEACGAHLLPKTDYARLVVAQELFDEGFGRVIWMDADLLVFSPEKLTIPDFPYAITREFWVEAGPMGQANVASRFANAAMLLTSENAFFSVYRQLLDLMVASGRRIGHLSFGTDLLSLLSQSIPFHTWPGIGLFSPALLKDVAAGGGNCIDAHRRVAGNQLAAGNICLSLINAKDRGSNLTSEIVEKAIEALCATKGEVLNGPADAPFQIMRRRNRN